MRRKRFNCSRRAELLKNRKNAGKRAGTFRNHEMDKKVEFIETEEGWSWFTMRYDKENESWYTVETGTEPTMTEACARAEEAYGWMA